MRHRRIAGLPTDEGNPFFFVGDNGFYRVSEKDLDKARGKNPSKAYLQYVVEDFDR